MFTHLLWKYLISYKQNNMKRITFKNLIALVLVFASLSFTGIQKLSAQELLSGTVKYQQTTKYDFSARSNQRWKDFVATLPQEGTYAFILNFSNGQALYEENTAEQEALSPRMQRAMHATNMGKPPKPELKKIYYDLEDNKKVEQLEFMTRNFIIESDIESLAWKITGEKKKILGYICVSADLKTGEDDVTAWFTSQIPVSVGPGEYSGLPGLVLAVEKNGATIFIASSIEMTPPPTGTIAKPDDGKKVTQKEFDKILEEKEKEFKKNTRDHEARGGGHRRP